MTRAHVAALAAVIIATAGARAQDRLGAPTPIEDPAGRVLPRLHAALRRAERGGGVARLAFWGGSHTASDQYTGFLRERLARRFGSGGPGLVLPAHPYSLHDRRDVAIASGAGWRGLMIRGRDHAVDRYGRAGCALETEVATWARATPREPISSVEVWSMPRPGGGTIELAIDGQPIARAPTGEQSPTFLLEHRLALGVHRVDVRTAGDGPVRLFGVMLEGAPTGVIVESFGVPGARARDALAWDEPSLREQLARRPPDLVTLAYGTNESGERTPLARLERDLHAALALWQRAAPGSACLLIGPSDWPITRAGEIVPRARTGEVRDLYRRVALASGCGFFDLLALQGGPGAITRWMAAGWALGDRVHMTDEGHARVAELLERALIAGY